jgi:hypothetical protein
MQNSATPHKCAVTFSLDGMKAREGSTLEQCIDDVRVFESHHQWSCLDRFCTFPFCSDAPILLHSLWLTDGVSCTLPHDHL